MQKNVEITSQSYREYPDKHKWRWKTVLAVFTSPFEETLCPANQPHLVLLS